MSEHSGCREVLEEYFAGLGIEAHVTAVPQIIDSGYEPLNMSCPHGVTYYAEPTSEQRARWAADGVA